MRIEHIAMWTHNLERLKAFYQTYFQATAGDKYTNAETGFESYFLSFADGARLELMRMPGVPASLNEVASQFTGYIHLAISVGSMARVEVLTTRLRSDGYHVLSGPRTTGDGYYESVVLDPDGNRLEITV